MRDARRPGRLIPFGSQYRASGMLLHIASLPSPYGIGGIGPAAFAMVDRLQAACQGWWQLDCHNRSAPVNKEKKTGNLCA
jgi:4-alpha-glucanotransferase